MTESGGAFDPRPQLNAALDQTQRQVDAIEPAGKQSVLGLRQVVGRATEPAMIFAPADSPNEHERDTGPGLAPQLPTCRTCVGVIDSEEVVASRC